MASGGKGPAASRRSGRDAEGRGKLTGTYLMRLSGIDMENRRQEGFGLEPAVGSD